MIISLKNYPWYNYFIGQWIFANIIIAYYFIDGIVDFNFYNIDLLDYIYVYYICLDILFKLRAFFINLRFIDIYLFIFLVLFIVLYFVVFILYNKNYILFISKITTK